MRKPPRCWRITALDVINLESLMVIAYNEPASTPLPTACCPHHRRTRCPLKLIIRRYAAPAQQRLYQTWHRTRLSGTGGVGNGRGMRSVLTTWGDRCHAMIECIVFNLLQFGSLRLVNTLSMASRCALISACIASPCSFKSACISSCCDSQAHRLTFCSLKSSWAKGLEPHRRTTRSPSPRAHH